MTGHGLRPIAAGGIKPPVELAAGTPPELAFVPIVNLRVDPAYQRRISRAGLKNIARIVGDFRWSRFSPVIVAPLEKSEPQLYVVIDGQHRASAAAACGFDTVPCQVIVADACEQAAAFAAVNAVVTKMHNLQVHHARLVADDPQALAIARVARAASCEILKYPVQTYLQKPGQTMAVASIGRSIADYGENTVITALQCITETENNFPGAICATTIKGFCVALDLMDRWREAGLTLFDVIDEFDVMSAIEKARVDEGAGWRNFAVAVAEHLAAHEKRLADGGGKVAA